MASFSSLDLGEKKKVEHNLKHEKKNHEPEHKITNLRHKYDYVNIFIYISNKKIIESLITIWIVITLFLLIL